MKQRAREAELLLVRSFQTPEFMRAQNLVLNLPDGLTKNDILKMNPEEKNLIFYWLGAWEAMGIMVFKREISMPVMDDYFSGPIIISWKKLSAYVEQDRKDLNRETMHEWYQWLAEHMLERENKIPVRPAHIAHKNWKE